MMTLLGIVGRGLLILLTLSLFSLGVGISVALANRFVLEWWRKGVR